jgi:hypothetical protein
MRRVEHLARLQNHFDYMLISVSLCGRARVCVQNKEIHYGSIKKVASPNSIFY